MRQIIKNLSFQTIYQVLAICLPLITTPYISRVIGAEGLGIYSYTYSIVNYFTILAMLGVLNYGSRTIAVVKKDKIGLSKAFFEIYSLQMVSSIIAIIGYVIVIFLTTENHNIMVIQTIWIFGCLFDISWFFFGIEKFKITVFRNAIIKILTVVSIFLFVKKEDDLWIYVVIMSTGTLISQIALWPFLKNEVFVIRPTIKGILSHLKPNLLLFVPLLAISVYHIMDKTMLGIFSSYEQSGYYYNADKVINIPLSLITATGTVMLPRMSSLVAEGKKEEGGRLFNQTLDLFMLLTYAMSFGIAAVSKEFIPIFFGSGYNECIRLIYVFSLVMIIKSLSSIIRNQYLIPNCEEKIYTYSVIAGMLLNFLCNYIFMVTMKLGAMGATLGTLVAETATSLFYIYFTQKRISIIGSIIKTMIYIIPGVIMYIGVRVCSLLSIGTMSKLCVEIIVGAGLYIGGCFLIHNGRKKSNRNQMYF